MSQEWQFLFKLCFSPRFQVRSRHPALRHPASSKTPLPSSTLAGALHQLLLPLFLLLRRQISSTWTPNPRRLLRTTTVSEQNPKTAAAAKRENCLMTICLVSRKDIWNFSVDLYFILHRFCFWINHLEFKINWPIRCKFHYSLGSLAGSGAARPVVPQPGSNQSSPDDQLLNLGPEPSQPNTDGGSGNNINTNNILSDNLFSSPGNAAPSQKGAAGDLFGAGGSSSILLDVGGAAPPPPTNQPNRASPANPIDPFASMNNFSAGKDSNLLGKYRYIELLLLSIRHWNKSSRVKKLSWRSRSSFGNILKRGNVFFFLLICEPIQIS